MVILTINRCLRTLVDDLQAKRLNLDLNAVAERITSTGTESVLKTTITLFALGNH